MLDVPGVAHWNGIFGLQADCTRPGDSCYPIRAFPLWRQLVGILGRLNCRKQGRLPQGSGHEPCSYGTGARLAGSVLLSQPPGDDLPQGTLHHLTAIALDQAHHKRALEVTHI